MDSANAASAASPRNNGSLAQRVLSAALLLPLLIVLVWWSIWSVAATVVVATVIGLIELYGAFRRAASSRGRLVGIASALAHYSGDRASSRRSRFDLLLLVLTFVIVVSLVVELAYPPSARLAAIVGADARRRVLYRLAVQPFYFAAIA